MSVNHFDTKKRDRYLGCLRKGMRHGEACRAAKISRCTVWKYKRDNPEFQAEIDQAEADYCDQVEKYLLKAAKKLNMTAIIFWLTNRSPERWKDRRNTAAQPQTTEGTVADELKKINARLEAGE